LTLLDVDIFWGFRDNYEEYNRACVVRFLRSRGHVLDGPAPLSPHNAYRHRPKQKMMIWSLPHLQKLAITPEASRCISIMSQSLQEVDIDVRSNWPKTVLLAREMLRDSPNIHQLRLQFDSLCQDSRSLLSEVFRSFQHLKSLSCSTLDSALLSTIATNCRQLQKLEIKHIQGTSAEDWLAVLALPELKKLKVNEGIDFMMEAEEKKDSAFSCSPVICSHVGQLRLPSCHQRLVDRMRCPALHELRIDHPQPGQDVLYLDGLAEGSGSSLLKLEVGVPVSMRLSQSDLSVHFSSLSSISCVSSACCSASSMASPISPWSRFSHLQVIYWRTRLVPSALDMAQHLPRLILLLLRESQISINDFAGVLAVRPSSPNFRTIIIQADETNPWPAGALDSLMPLLRQPSSRFPQLVSVEVPAQAFSEHVARAHNIPVLPSNSLSNRKKLDVRMEVSRNQHMGGDLTDRSPN